MARSQHTVEPRERARAAKRDSPAVVQPRALVGGSLRSRPRLLDALVAAIAMAASVLLLFPLFGLARASLSVPFAYQGDALFYEMVVKGVIDHGWYLRNPSLGAPLGQQLFDFPHGADNLNFALIRTLALVSDDPAVVMNLFFLLTFPLVALSAYLVLRRLEIGRLAAFVCSLLYALAPYHLSRSETHLLLSAYYAVPLGAYLVLSLYTGRPLFTRRAEPRRRLLAFASGTTLVTLLLCAVVASTGVYYAAFTILLVAAATIAAALARRSVRTLATGAAVAGAILTVLTLNLAPTLVYRAAHGANAVVPSRAPEQADEQSLHIAHLVIPPSEDRIGFLARLSEEYTDDVPQAFVSERPHTSLGSVTAVAFLALLVVALAAAAGARWIRPLLVGAAAATIGALLFAATGGFGTLLSYYGTPLLRAGNRISIFVAFFSLVALALFLDWVARRLDARRLPPLVSVAVAAVVMLFALYEQASPAFTPQYDAVALEYEGDAAFVRSIEARLPRDAAVFQLPHIPFPENPIGRIVQYDPVRGYIHSDRLRWSYGAMTGRPDDWITARAMDLPVRLLLPAAVASRFQGIWIDRFGYSDRARALERQVTAVTGTSPQTSANGRFSFFDIRRYADGLRAGRSPAELASLRAATVTPLRFESGPGLTALEQSGLDDPAAPQGYRRFTWRWMTERQARLQVVNPHEEQRTAALQAIFQAGRRTGSLRVTYPDGRTETLPLTTAGRYVVRSLALPPGRSFIELDYSGPELGDPTAAPPRSVYVRVMTRLTDVAYAPFGQDVRLQGCAQPYPTGGCVAAG